MAVSAIAPPAVNQWVTPQEQLDRLHDELHDYMVSPLKEETSGCLGSALEDMVVEYIDDPNLSHWFRALQRIDALPDTIPPLPRDIVKILNSDCPIRDGESKPDGTTYKVTDTHSLYLIPPDSLTQFEARVRGYGAHIYPPRENPLQLECILHEAFVKYGNVRSDTYEWVLISNDVLKGSRGESYLKQAQMVADLSGRAFATYEVPALREAALAMFLHKVATGKSLLEQEGCSGTRVRERIWSRSRLAIGGFGSAGMSILDDNFLGGVGIAVLRKVSS